MTLEEEAILGERARQLLDDPVMKGALEEIERQTLDGLEHCPLKETELRDRLWMLFCTARMFRRNLESVMTGGEIAVAQLKEKTAWQRAKEVIGIHG